MYNQVVLEFGVKWENSDVGDGALDEIDLIQIAAKFRSLSLRKEYQINSKKIIYCNFLHLGYDVQSSGINIVTEFSQSLNKDEILLFLEYLIDEIKSWDNICLGDIVREISLDTSTVSWELFSEKG